MQTAKASRKQSSLSGTETAQGCIPKRLFGRPDEALGGGNQAFDLVIKVKKIFFLYHRPSVGLGQRLTSHMRDQRHRARSQGSALLDASKLAGGAPAASVPFWMEGGGVEP